jgi:hypothetical protein
MPAAEQKRMRTGRSLRQPLVSMVALTLVAIALVALLLRLGA